MFLSCAVAGSWHPTVVSVLPPPSWGNTYLLPAVRGLWPFFCSFCSGHSCRCPPTALDQKKIRSLMNEEWAPMPYKLVTLRTLSLAHTTSSPKMAWSGIPLFLGTQGKAINTITTANWSFSVKCHDLLMQFYLVCLYF